MASGAARAPRVSARRDPSRHVFPLGAASPPSVTPPRLCARPVRSQTPRSARWPQAPHMSPLTRRGPSAVASPHQHPPPQPPQPKPRPRALIGRPLLALRDVDSAAASDWLQRPPLCGERGGAPGAASRLRDPAKRSGAVPAGCPRARSLHTRIAESPRRPAAPSSRGREAKNRRGPAPPARRAAAESLERGDGGRGRSALSPAP